MIMMQDEAYSGEPHPHGLATAETMRDWDMLNSVFGSDRGVLFELYNEPELNASTANWALWANGSTTDAGADIYVGMQTMINRLRAEACESRELSHVYEIDSRPLPHDLLAN